MSHGAPTVLVIAAGLALWAASTVLAVNVLHLFDRDFGNEPSVEALVVAATMAPTFTPGPALLIGIALHPPVIYVS